jgi:hypothetical protein
MTLGEKYLKMVERAIEDPSIQGVIDSEVKLSREESYSFYILWICSHAYAMRKRNILDDNEWVGWLQWMRHIFRRGTIRETWKQIEPDKWFNPDFHNFINKEIVGAKVQSPTFYDYTDRRTENNIKENWKPLIDWDKPLFFDVADVHENYYNTKKMLQTPLALLVFY